MTKRSTESKGLRYTKTMHTIKRRSIPRAQSSAYLDLYMLGKEKDRLEKETKVLEDKRTAIQKRLDDIDKEMEKLQKLEARRGQQAAKREEPEESAEKKWKTMHLKY